MYAEKLPPHDIAAEEAAIGSILVDGDALTRVASFLKPEDFYREKHRWCYEVFLALFERGEAINQVTVGHELERLNHLDDIGGQAYLSHLISQVPTPIHVEHYGRIIRRTATMRRLIQAAGEIAAIGYEGGPDSDASLRQAEDVLYRLRLGQSARDFLSLRQVLDLYLEETAPALTPQEQGAVAVDTGFLDLDTLLGGLHHGDLVVLAARPGLGKSSLALSMARNAAGNGAHVAIFSLEMSKEELAQRLIASESRIDTHRLRLGRHTDAEERLITDAIGKLAELPIWIDDSPLLNIVEMRSKARRLHIEQGLNLVVLDYLQMMHADIGYANRVQEVSEISRFLKGLARDLNVPLVACSQLSRAPEQRPSHMPQLSDLRESGSIEQDADVVLFIHREDLYVTEEEWNRRSAEPYPKNIADILIAKHRHGPTGRFQLYFRDKLARFENFAPSTGART